MGRSLSTKLVYGYDLGGDNDEGWKFNLSPKVIGAGTDWSYEHEDVSWPGWVTLDNDDEDGPDYFIGQATDRLMAVLAGFTEEWSGFDDKYFTRRKEAKKAAGLDVLGFALYGVGDYTSWAFGVDLGSGTSLQTVDVTKLSPAELAKNDVLLRRALDVLEIKPTDQPAPRLLSLASYF